MVPEPNPEGLNLSLPTIEYVCPDWLWEDWVPLAPDLRIRYALWVPMHGRRNVYQVVHSWTAGEDGTTWRLVHDLG